MSIHDPIADALTIVRNGVTARKSSVELKFSNKILGIVKILKEEGYVKNYKKLDAKGKRRFPVLQVELKYVDKENVLGGIKRVSKPGLRQYASVEEMPRVRNGLGIAIMSTPEGIITDKKARSLNVGGEVLCFVW